jgi:hypothetical protein
MLGLVVVGTPMVFLIWEFVNDLLAARATARAVLITLPVIALFVGYLVFVSRMVRRWTGAGAP